MKGKGLNKTAGDGAGGDSQADRRFAGLGEVRIGLCDTGRENENGEGREKYPREESKPAIVVEHQHFFALPLTPLLSFLTTHLPHSSL